MADFGAARLEAQLAVSMWMFSATVGSLCWPLLEKSINTHQMMISTLLLAISVEIGAMSAFNLFVVILRRFLDGTCFAGMHVAIS